MEERRIRRKKEERKHVKPKMITDIESANEIVTRSDGSGTKAYNTSTNIMELLDKDNIFQLGNYLPSSLQRKEMF